MNSQKGGQSLEERGNRARELFWKGHYEEALKRFNELISESSRTEDKTVFLLDKIGCLERLGRIQEAWETLNEAKSIFPRDRDSWHNIVFFEAGLDMAERKPKKALRKLDRILRERAKMFDKRDDLDFYVEIQTRRGNILVVLRKYSKALPVLEECMTFEHNRWKRNTLYDLAMCCFELGRSAEARRHFEQLTSGGANDKYAATAHYYLGVLLSRDEAFARAKVELELSLNLLSADAKSERKVLYEALVFVCRELGLKSEAQRFEQAAVEAGD